MSDALEAFDDAYNQANDRRWTAYTFDFSGGRFKTELPIPLDAHGACFVRVHLRGREGYALGATRVYVRRARSAAAVD